ncbi:MAG: group III truncated hemoglobin [Pseudomonadota bacterium]|nr:group III truncated hemoglobin [Pseudomonadota bacterium]
MPDHPVRAPSGGSAPVPAPVRDVARARREIQAEAARLGIDDAYVSTLVETFYARVRADPALGPVFEREVGDDWPAHLARLKDFWASVAFNAGRYSGRPVQVHRALTGVAPGHFATWLGIFEATLRDTAPSPAAADHFLSRAHRIAATLRAAMFGPEAAGSGDAAAAPRRAPEGGA